MELVGGIVENVPQLTGGDRLVAKLARRMTTPHQPAAAAGTGKQFFFRVRPCVVQMKSLITYFLVHSTSQGES